MATTELPASLIFPFQRLPWLLSKSATASSIVS
jgi:hypothetical protein